MEKWLSGLRRTTGNRVNVDSVSRVQIPSFPPCYIALYLVLKRTFNDYFLLNIVLFYFREQFGNKNSINVQVNFSLPLRLEVKSVNTY